MTDKKKPRRATLPIPDAVAHEITQAAEATGIPRARVVQIVSAGIWESLKGKVAERVIADVTGRLKGIGGAK